MLRAEAETLFARHSPYEGPALENHNLRILAFTLALGRTNDVSLDEDLVAAGSYLHDLGLLVSDPTEPSYLRRSWRFVEGHARSWGVDPDGLRVLEQILLYNHSLRSLPGLEPAAELVRRAVQIEHSRGLRRHGLPRASIREVFARHPRLDLTRILLDFARITFIEDGTRQLLPMFLPSLP